MSFDWKTETLVRLRRRLEIIAPEARGDVRFEGETGDADADVVLVVRAESAPPLAGFVRVSADSFRRPEPLHAVVGRVSRRMGAMFAPGAIFHHVGDRLTFRRMPGLLEECWVREGSGVEIRAASATPAALRWITVGGIGYLPVIGATFASLATALAVAGVAACWGAAAAWVFAIGVAGIATVASLLVEAASERHFLSDDAREFVLDEVAGMALTLVFVPAHALPWGVAVGFCAFRFFDVLKPGISWIEQRTWRGKIVWDDLLAGLYAGLCTMAILIFV